MIQLHMLLLLVIVAAIAFGIMKLMKVIKKKKKENFIMQLYRPTPVVSVPENEWDPASMLTQALPSKSGPKLVIEKGNYRRFQRV